MATMAIEDYLKCIYLEQQKRPGDTLIPTGQIASALKVAPGTATAMVKTLADSGLVSYEPYNGVRLTPAGRKLAVHVLRRHRIVELFLVQVLKMDWSEVHDDAERLEHAISDRLLDCMDEMLGFPTLDPHGDPIPNASGVIQEFHHPSLVKCELGRPYRIARVTDQGVEFLRHLQSKQLVLGSRLEVLARNEPSDTVRLAAPGALEVSLGFRAASKILVQPIEDEETSEPSAPTSR